MLNDKQSLLLCGLMAVGIFVTGILGIFSNFIVLTILTIIFLAVVINLVVSNTKTKKGEGFNNEKK